MEIAVPSSRSPQALRGAVLRDALRKLGNGVDTPQPPSAVVSRGPVFEAATQVPFVPEPLDDDEEPAPRALRPHELASWLPHSV
jgi:hypothetical protein